MLTLKQINEISFRKSSFSGYKPEDVDDFIDEVSETFTAILKENQALKAKAADLSSKNSDMREKLTILAQKIESYRDDEDGIKNALLSAQKLGAASIKEAKLKADNIISDANIKADSMVEDAKRKTSGLIASYDSKIADKEKEFDAIKAAVTSFRSSLYDMYRNHLTAIESIPDFSSELAEKAATEIVDTEPEVTAPEEVTKEFVNEPETVEELPTEETPTEEDINDYIPDEVYEEAANYDDEPVPETEEEEIAGIDLNAYADIPESLKKEKESLYSTLEFGEDINLKK